MNNGYGFSVQLGLLIRYRQNKLSTTCILRSIKYEANIYVMVSLSQSLCLFSEFIFQFFGLKNERARYSRPEKKMSLKFVKIVLEMIVIKHLVEVNYCYSFNHTAGNRHPFGPGLFRKFIFVCIGKLNSFFLYLIVSFVCVLGNGLSVVGFPQDLLHQDELFEKTSFQPKSYSIIFKYHANSFSGPPFFVQLNVNGAEVSSIPFSVYSPKTVLILF